MIKAKVTTYGNNGKKLTLPKVIWEKLEVIPGDEVEFIIQKNGKIVIQKVKEEA